MKKLTKDKIAEIIELYQGGMTPKDIGAKFGIYNNSVTRILRKKGIERDQQIRVCPEDVQYCIEQYKAGKSSPLIASELDINDSTVCRILKRNDVSIREAELTHRLYPIDFDYFKEINTEEKAYFLGFLYADGTIFDGGGANSRYEIRLMLHTQDRDILERFSRAIYLGKDKTEENEFIDDNGVFRSYPRVKIYSKRMMNHLIGWGCTPRKSFSIRMPTFLSDDLLHHFIRGYFDGDGCICITNPDHPRVDFSSNCIFIGELIAILTKNGMRCNKPGVNSENPLSGNVQMSSIDSVLKCYHYLYDDATIFMQRKYNSFQELIAYTNEKRKKKLLKSNDPSLYATTYIPSFNGKQLTTENVKQLTKEDKDRVVEFLVGFYQDVGFPYSIKSDSELFHEFTILKNTDANSIENNHILRTDNQNGNYIFKHFSPHFFEVKSGSDPNRASMLEVFEDPELFGKVLKNRLDGEFHINGNMIRQGLANSKLSFKASIFNTVIAKFIYSKFAKENDIIYDYSMGFGQRLTAAMSLPYHLKYVGVDVLEKSVVSNQNIFNFLDQNVPGLNKEAELHCLGSEEFCDPNLIGKVNVAFSSPPYFMLELYEQDDAKQAYRNNDYLYFINWWKKTVANIDQLLTSDGLFIINICKEVDIFAIEQDMCNVIREKGFELQETYQMQITRNLQFGNRQEHKMEPIHIFKRKTNK
jgi:hypothetical protein